MRAMHLVRRERWSRVAALTVTLMLPSLVHANGLEPASEDPFAEGDAKSEDAEEPKGDDASAGEEAPADVIHPDLAEQVPKLEWVYEGEGQGGGDKSNGGVEVDPREMNRKIRRAGKVTLAGGGIAIGGALLALTGLGLRFAGSSSRLNKLKENGLLPVDDAKRQRILTMGYVSPIIMFTGIGVLAAGVITAAVARSRLKKLREQRRTSIIAVTPTTYGQGAELHWELRF
jgi:hypothetical protein